MVEKVLSLNVREAGTMLITVHNGLPCYMGNTIYILAGAEDWLSGYEKRPPRGPENGTWVCYLLFTQS